MKAVWTASGKKTDLAVDVENLVVKYKTSEATVEAVNSISLKVKKKRTLGLVGETGAGKTTAMLALMNMVPNPPGIITGWQCKNQRSGYAASDTSAIADSAWK